MKLLKVHLSLSQWKLRKLSKFLLSSMRTQMKLEMSLLVFNCPTLHQREQNYLRNLLQLSALLLILKVKRRLKLFNNFSKKSRMKRRLHGVLNSFKLACFIQLKTRMEKSRILALWTVSYISAASDGNSFLLSFLHHIILEVGHALLLLSSSLVLSLLLLVSLLTCSDVFFISNQL